MVSWLAELAQIFEIFLANLRQIFLDLFSDIGRADLIAWIDGRGACGSLSRLPLALFLAIAFNFDLDCSALLLLELRARVRLAMPSCFGIVTIFFTVIIVPDLKQAAFFWLGHVLDRRHLLLFFEYSQNLFENLYHSWDLDSSDRVDERISYVYQGLIL